MVRVRFCDVQDRPTVEDANLHRLSGLPHHVVGGRDRDLTEVESLLVGASQDQHLGAEPDLAVGLEDGLMRGQRVDQLVGKLEERRMRQVLYRRR
jgi:hypothetical protein